MHPAAHHDADGKTLRAFSWIGKGYFFAIPVWCVEAECSVGFSQKVHIKQGQMPMHPAIDNALQGIVAIFDAFLQFAGKRKYR